MVGMSEFLSVLKGLTAQQSILWRSLSDYALNAHNSPLKTFLIQNNRYIYSVNNKVPYISEDASFVAEIDGGFVYMFCFSKGSLDSDYFILASQVHPSINILQLNTPITHQEEVGKFYVVVKHFREGHREIENAEFIENIVRKYKDVADEDDNA